MTRPTRLLAASAIAAAAVAFSGVAAAETETITVSDFSFRFAYDKADLANPDVARETYRQLSVAAASACRHESPSAMRFVDRSCKAAVMSGVIDRMNSASMSNMFQASAEYARLQDKATEIASR
jgi:UrcA family protein